MFRTAFYHKKKQLYYFFFFNECPVARPKIKSTKIKIPKAKTIANTIGAYITNFEFFDSIYLFSLFAYNKQFDKIICIFY